MAPNIDFEYLCLLELLFKWHASGPANHAVTTAEQKRMQRVFGQWRELWPTVSGIIQLRERWQVQSMIDDDLFRPSMLGVPGLFCTSCDDRNWS